MIRVVLVFCLFACCHVTVPAQPQMRNPVIERLVREISEDSIRATIEQLSGFRTRHTLSDTGGAAAGIGAARRWLKQQFEQYAKTSGGRLAVALEETVAKPSRRIPAPVTIVNVMATLHPTDRQHLSSQRTLVVCAHYDSRSADVLDATSAAPGADDDGSGTAVVLELARVMSRFSFNATIIFACFAGEEQGLIGSTAMAESAKARELQIEAVLNNDIVGNIHGGNGEYESTYVRLFSEAFSPLDTGLAFRNRNSLGLENDGPSRSLARYIKEAGERYAPAVGVELVYRRDRFLRGGDHTPFHQNGFAAVRFSEAKENFDHQHREVRLEHGRQYGDLPAFVNIAYCTNIARINAAAIAEAAWAPAAPADATLLTDQLEYQTRLRWKANTEPELAGYFVRYRKTTAPVWEHSFFTTDTSMTLDVSKDDYLFGVQSVSKSGDASLLSIPLPRR